jgi:hypothetical protein
VPAKLAWLIDDLERQAIEKLQIAPNRLTYGLVTTWIDLLLVPYGQLTNYIALTCVDRETLQIAQKRLMS